MGTVAGSNKSEKIHLLEGAGQNGTNETKDMTVDKILDKISQRASFRYVLMILGLNLHWLAAPSVLYVSVFTGMMPTAADWSCSSAKCLNVVKNFNSSAGDTPLCAQYTNNTGPTVFLLNTSDITWHPQRTSFPIDFDLYCATGDRVALKTLVSSIYFLGEFSRLMIGSYLLDNIGRKKIVLVSALTNIVMTFSGTFCNSYSFLLVIRFVQGIGNIVTTSGTYIMALELVPTKYRHYLNAYCYIMWACGYFVVATAAYLITNWHDIFFAASILTFLGYSPLAFAIESPRFYMMKNDKEATKESLKELAAMNGVDIELDLATMTFNRKTPDVDEHGIYQQMYGFYKYPLLLIELLLQMFMWGAVAMSYYGFNYSWNTIIPNLYLGYCLAAIGELIGSLGVILFIHYLGRRRTMMLLFLCACSAYIISIPNVHISENWRLDSIAGLVGASFVTAAFSGLYLYTGELAPTSHRGFIFCMASSSARVGSFIGPFLFNNLTELVPRDAILMLLACLHILCCLCASLLVETGTGAIAVVPSDVTKRRNGWKWTI